MTTAPVGTPCHCDACDFGWREVSEDWDRQAEIEGLQCTNCRRIFCRECLRSYEMRGGVCPCGEGRMRQITSPNGRPDGGSDEEAEPDSVFRDLFGGRSTLEAPHDPLLLVGRRGTLPGASDAGFPTSALDAADAERWARLLLGIGQPHAADCVLAGVAEDPSPTLELLRIELDNVRRAYCEENKGSSYVLRRMADDLWARTRDRLTSLTAAQPSFGPAWLKLADFELESAANRERAAAALAHAQRAEALLGRDHPGVALALGRAMRACGRPDEAIEILKPASHNAAGAGEMTQAEIELRAQKDPPDGDAVLRWGKRLIDDHNFEQAKWLFERVVRLAPERPHGYWGLGRLKTLDWDVSVKDRIVPAFELAHRALALDPDFGPANELMGQLLRSAAREGVSISSPLSWRDHYILAIQSDDPYTADLALETLAEEAIEAAKPDGAFAFLKRAADGGTRQNGVYLKLAVFYQAQRDSKSRDDAYRKAKQLRPDLELESGYRERLLKIIGFQY